MKRLSFDFKNKMLGIETEGQRGTEYLDTLNKSMLDGIVPNDVLDNDCLTLDFDNEVVYVNEDIEADREAGELIVLQSFVPVKKIQVEGLADKYDAVISAIGFEEVDMSGLADIINAFLN